MPLVAKGRHPPVVEELGERDRGGLNDPFPERTDRCGRTTVAAARRQTCRAEVAESAAHQIARWRMRRHAPPR
jgi:hypothetical protein